MKPRLPSPGTLRPIIMISGVVVAVAVIAAVAFVLGRSDTATGAAAGCDIGRILSNDISESSGILPSGQQLRVISVEAPGTSKTPFLGMATGNVEDSVPWELLRNSGSLGGVVSRRGDVVFANLHRA